MKLESVEEVDENGWKYWNTLINFFLYSQKRLFAGLLVYRVLNVWAIQTSFVPDEYWQSLEIAHQSAFGYGYETWEWKFGLRSYCYPMIFALIYKFVQFLHIDYQIVLIKVPLLLHALLATTADIFSYRLTFKLCAGNTVAARWALFVQVTSWYIFYTCTRTLTNSVEMSLTTIGLFYYPWPHKTMSKQSNQTWHIYILLVACCVIIRPTAVIFWLPFIIWNLSTSRKKGQYYFFSVIKNYTTRSFLVFLLSLFIDRIFYDEWTFPLFNFFYFNIINNVGVHYGTHSIFWYIYSGFPILLGPFILLFIYAIYHCIEKVCLFMIAFVILIYSLLDHKEFRFLSAIMPLVVHICGCTLHQFFSINQKNGFKKVRIKKRNLHIIKWFYIYLSILINIILSFYLSLIHQRGVLDASSFLGKTVDPNKDYILQLMPCHSMPFYSHLHLPVQMRFLTCEPNLTKKPNYLDEAEMFYMAPDIWLTTNIFLDSSENTSNKIVYNETFIYKSNFEEIKKRSKRTSNTIDNLIKIPTYVVLFDVLYNDIYPFLSSRGYKERAKYFHTHFPCGRIGKFIYILNL